LGKFGSDRVVPLNPGLYGGRYSNPPYYIEPRQFSGWLEVATKAFDSPSGCDPKTPPLISFHDIKDRTKDLSTSLRNDPRLSKDPDCVKDTPFNALLDRKTKAHMDGVVRTTIRAYVTEYFMKGYGLFSNVEMTPDNFDQGMFLYITKKMKGEMYDLGTSFNNRRISIVREKYWYIFLEQCVEAYQRMIDVDGIAPPEHIMSALNEIQKGIDAYTPINRNIKRRMRLRLKNNGNIIRKPSKNFNPLDVVREGSVNMGLQSIAFRLTTEIEEKENFFDGSEFDDYTSGDLWWAAIKKLKFFQKIYFIALYEQQATLIMSELIKQEQERLMDIIVDGLYDKPTYHDLKKAVFSMMPGSTSKVGLSSFNTEKQISDSPNPGSVPEAMGDNSAPPIAPTDTPQFIVESYARLVDREDPDLLPLIKNRAQKYVGVIPLSVLSDFIDQNIDALEENYLSDFFGNLTFLYKGSFKKLLSKGFTDREWISRLHQLNKGEGVNIAELQNARTKYMASREFDDFEVVYDEAFVLPGEKPEPVDTFGTTGVKYGLRLSIVFPEGFLSQGEITQIRSNSIFMNRSKNEKSYMFDDGSFVLPIVSEEIDVLDAKFVDFDPYSGTERYDLECLINKISKSPDFTLFMDKIFNLKQTSSLLGVYCMETFMPSLGRKIAPEGDTDSDNYERIDGPDRNPEQDWDGTINQFGKNSLRRQFKSLYLSRTLDGTHLDDDDDGLGLRGLFQMGNPLDFLSLPAFRIPWWQRRRMKTKIYDANGQECADPKKDLT
jgi:hypothetical protein